MRTLTEPDVERAFQRVDTLAPEQIEALVGGMSREQPYLQTYLLAVGGELLNADEREVLNFLGVLAWQAMVLAGGHVHQVSGDELERAETGNLAMLRYLEGEQIDEFTDVAQSVMNNTNQPELVRFVVEALMEAPEPDSEFREENAGIMFLYLKTAIDCLDQASH